jgi:hypothetical protein
LAVKYRLLIRDRDPKIAVVGLQALELTLNSRQMSGTGVEIVKRLLSINFGGVEFTRDSGQLGRRMKKRWSTCLRLQRQNLGGDGRRTLAACTGPGGGRLSLREREIEMGWDGEREYIRRKVDHL